jgi:hypothetical protein
MISTKYNRLIARKINNNERLAISRESANNRDEPVQYHEQTRHTSTLGEKLREAEGMLPKKKVTFAKPVEPVKGLVVGAGKSDVKMEEVVDASTKEKDAQLHTPQGSYTSAVEKDYKKQVPKVGGGMEMAKEEAPKRVLGGSKVKKPVKGAKLLSKTEVPIADSSNSKGQQLHTPQGSYTRAVTTEVPIVKPEVPISGNVGEMNKNSSSQGGSNYAGLKWNDLIKAVCKDRKCAMKEAIAHIKSNNLYNRTSA